MTARPLCIDADPALFFPEKEDNPRSYNAGKQWCAECPVREACLKQAMDDEGGKGSSSRFGLWGGLSPVERASLARAMRRPDRPRRPAPKRLKTPPGEACAEKKGSRAGYLRHWNKKEAACGPCLAGQAEHSRAVREAKRASVA